MWCPQCTVTHRVAWYFASIPSSSLLLEKNISLSGLQISLYFMSVLVCLVSFFVSKLKQSIRAWLFTIKARPSTFSLFQIYNSNFTLLHVPMEICNTQTRELTEIIYVTFFSLKSLLLMRVQFVIKYWKAELVLGRLHTKLHVITATLPL